MQLHNACTDRVLITFWDRIVWDYCGGIQYALSGILECLWKFLLFWSVIDKRDYIKI